MKKIRPEYLKFVVMPVLFRVIICILELCSGMQIAMLFCLAVADLIFGVAGVVSDTIADEHGFARAMPLRAATLAIMLLVKVHNIITSTINAFSIIACILTGISFLYHILMVGYNIKPKN